MGKRAIVIGADGRQKASMTDTVAAQFSRWPQDAHVPGWDRSGPGSATHRMVRQRRGLRQRNAQSTSSGVGLYPIIMSNMGVSAAVSAQAKAGGSDGDVQYNAGAGKFGGVANSSCDSGGNCSWGGRQSFGSVLGTVTTQSGTAYTLAASDCGTEINFTAGTAVTVTIPNTLPAGCNIAMRQGGAGAVTLSAAAGATLNSPHNYTKTFGQYSIIGISVISNVGGSAAVADFTGDGA